MKKEERIPTGIKDINNRMIFVDDIVKVTYGNAENNFSETKKLYMKMENSILITRTEHPLLTHHIIL